MTTKTNQPDLIAEVEELLAKATPRWEQSFFAVAYVISLAEGHEVVCSFGEYREDGTLETEFKNAGNNMALTIRAPDLLRRLVAEVRERDELIVHMHVHSGYPNNGYMQMTTPQKELYDAIWNRSVKELDDEERNGD